MNNPTYLLLDLGNTHLHLGLGNATEVFAQTEVTHHWISPGQLRDVLEKFRGTHTLTQAMLASVVPNLNSTIHSTLQDLWGLSCEELDHRTTCSIGIDYPNQQTIGADRLANSIAAAHHYGSPSVVVDFGTAVTFDVIDEKSNYVGGIIAPGLAAMTDYLHEKTALLPKISIREVETTIGKSTQEAMLIGAVHGYRGLIKELLARLSRELNTPDLPVVATGGYAHLMAQGLPAIQHVQPNLTLEGIRLALRYLQNS